MKVGISTLRVLLENNVLEIKFKRRRPKAGAPATRRMLCTNNPVVLQSSTGRQTLHYKTATGTPKYSPTAKNLVIAWDIFKQDYRAISGDNIEVINTIPYNSVLVSVVFSQQHYDFQLSFYLTCQQLCMLSSF